jgi:transcription antitermination protein NusB
MTANAPKPTEAPLQPPRPRSIARTAAVQALYQMDIAGTDLNLVIAEFQHVRFAPDILAAAGCEPVRPTDPDEKAEGADPQFFADILRGVVRRQRDIDPMIDTQLADGWRLVRVDSILRAILRAGVFELIERTDVPARVVINEYINVAHAFFDEEEPRVVNGVLDRIARSVRATELAGGGVKKS